MRIDLYLNYTTDATTEAYIIFPAVYMHVCVCVCVCVCVFHGLRMSSQADRCFLGADNYVTHSVYCQLQYVKIDASL